MLSPGYSIAAVIANEFAEASGELYVSSLIYAGLVLFGLTIVINAVARILILATSQRVAHSMTAGISPVRRIVGAVMLSLSGICTLLVIGVLFFILGYLFVHGVKSLDLDFFTKLPKPSGETGGGMANAIVGSGKVLLMATMIGVPIGFLAGVFLAEYSGKTFAFIIRYIVDLLNGVPSIVIGIVAYALVVRPMHHYSALAGGVALGIMMIPIAVRTTEEFLRAVPNSLREGAMALGATKAQTIFSVVVPAAISGLISGMMLNLARVAGETAPLVVHRAR